MVPPAHDTTGPALASGRILGGRYEIHERLGEGGMAVVYRATDQSTRREVALKLLAPTASQDERAAAQLLTEGQKTARIRHPNVVELYDYGRLPDGAFYLAMELVHGEPLEEVIARDGALAPARVLRIMRQVASAVAEAHRQGLVHRDLTPANIMLVPPARPGGPERAVVLDFGIAVQSARRSDDTPRDRLGSTAYASPEQIEGLPLDARSDVYSLGVVMFQMLTGRHPCGDEAPLALSSGDEPGDEVVRRALEKIVVQSMVPDRRQRLADARLLLHELERIQGTATRRRERVAMVKRQRGWQTTATYAIAAAGGALFLFVALLAAFGR